jgi:hypothetical protein
VNTRSSWCLGFLRIKNERAPDEKKRHHYNPVTYLKGFVDASGCVFAWRKDEPETPLYTAPESIGFEKYYYSQPPPGGGRDNNSLEDFFSSIEAPWPQLMEKLAARTETSADFLPLIEFLMLQRVRVPCIRDAIEFNLAETVKIETRVLDEAGLLPPKPEAHPNILENLEVSIDPHMSIHAMTSLMTGFARVVDACVFEVLHNQTNIGFLTSDNPVAVFDPSVPETQMKPYQLHADRQSIELLFPLTSRLMLRGAAGSRFAPAVTHLHLTSEHEVKRLNRISAKFGYRMIFANSQKFAVLAQKYASLSPVPKFECWRDGNGYATKRSFVWGQRLTKPKWSSLRDE